MSAFIFNEVDISTIRHGDTILHEGEEITVDKKDITITDFMGISIFGDCYHSGCKKVLKGVLRNGRK